MTRRILAEGLGTFLLLVAVVGSGIMGSALAAGNDAVALLANALATGCALYVLITVLGPVSGAHFNPAVTLVFLGLRQISATVAAAYVVVQIAGGVLGVLAAHAMFDQPILQVSTTLRDGPHLAFAEVTATFGLLFTILGGIRFASVQVPALVAAYITGAYWFTASTSFANPAVTIARTLTDTFAGIAPASAPAFIGAQLAGAVLALLVVPRLFTD
ncbi:MAG: aquaporin family protein [Rhodobacteraceae bacterium]|nr:aquaporin family protein [Paracoccaceae bacterium]